MNLKVAQKIWARLDVLSAASPKFSSSFKGAREISRLLSQPKTVIYPVQPALSPCNPNRRLYRAFSKGRAASGGVI